MMRKMIGWAREGCRKKLSFLPKCSPRKQFRLPKISHTEVGCLVLEMRLKSIERYNPIFWTWIGFACPPRRFKLQAPKLGSSASNFAHHTHAQTHPRTHAPTHPRRLALSLSLPGSRLAFLSGSNSRQRLARSKHFRIVASDTLSSPSRRLAISSLHLPLYLSLFTFLLK